MREDDRSDVSRSDENESTDNEGFSEPRRTRYSLLRDLKEFMPSNKQRPRTLNPIFADAKFVGREIHMGINVRDVICFGPRLKAAVDGSNIEPIDDIELFEGEAEKILTQYNNMLSLIRCLEGDLKVIGDNTAALDGLVRVIECAINQARREDCKKLRKSVVTWLPIVLKAEHLGENPPTILDEVKAGRGFNHISTARLLVAADDLEEFDRNPTGYCNRVINIQVIPCAGDFQHSSTLKSTTILRRRTRAPSRVTYVLWLTPLYGLELKQCSTQR